MEHSGLVRGVVVGLPMSALLWAAILVPIYRSGDGEVRKAKVSSDAQVVAMIAARNDRADLKQIRIHPYYSSEPDSLIKSCPQSQGGLTGGMIVG